MIIQYGILDNRIDVTEVCFEKLKRGNEIFIPFGDASRASFFGDPVVGELKKIFITVNNKVNVFSHNYTVRINIDNEHITWKKDDAPEKLAELHSKLKIHYGNFSEEFPEQLMAMRFISPDSKVLEIGGNIGRNSLIISSILNDSSNLVVLECTESIANQLGENRYINELKFHIEPAALSKRKLAIKGWNSVPCEDGILPEGHNWINTITLEDLRNKYPLEFDTLVLDCEGAFYYILQDTPEILDGVKVIVMENDYWNIEHKNFVDEVMTARGFVCSYSEPGGWGPCFNRFFETWEKV